MTVNAEDGWDLASGVGLTATETAAARAVAGRKPGALIADPFAEILVRAVGVKLFVDLVAADLEEAESGFALPRLVDFVAVRTAFFDGFLAAAQEVGIRQVVILGAGLDSRAYRLDWSPSTTVYELDQPAVIQFKTAAMDGTRARARSTRIPIAVDLTGDWEQPLRAGGFDPELPTAWCAEGLIPYLPPGHADAMLDTITTLSAAGSRLAADIVTDIEGLAGQMATSRSFNERPSTLKVDIRAGETVATSTRPDLSDYLELRGWRTESRAAPDLFELHGLPALADSLSIYQRIRLVTASDPVTGQSWRPTTMP
ncbi:SAM-dependent methyltransferase [Mycobacterium sp. CVI_P3]|uniref:S-adenosyl-L-methionine-dependent methyltransferase n=1 Tax=Mycobacterium pinniadriaticum TaxID=2994102 RepID=A0ABT3SEH2_9MYCO|nr:SAM-dependent methyltransferase [Mycobacterium pinniadriaticum]MCX2930861.1 SAM-dependent methyltransferase [Mycobacterium pinniadriaticum]MCX2937285.1 SAM-dependent methyltransferase [Mycobacterium pinniadriaticum]